MDATLRGLIDEVVGEWIQGSRIFTAFEITLELKNRGAQVRHRDAKEEVHSAIQRIGGGSYTRTLMDVGAPTDAFVYHPSGGAPVTYQPLNRNDATSEERRSQPARPVQASASSNGSDSQATAPPTDESFQADDGGNLKVPARFVQAMSKSPGDQLEVRFREYDEQIELTGTGPGGLGETLSVDDRGEVVVTREQLERVGLDGLESYQIAASDHSIAISGDW